MIGLIVGAAILVVVALPSYIKAFGSLSLYGTSNIVFFSYLIAAIGATGGGLFLLIWGGVNKHKADKIHTDGEKKLSLINAKDDEKRVTEIKSIDEEYERELARYQSELNKYRESLSQRKVDYDEFIASNSRFISSCRAKYAKIGEECFPNHYQDFVDIQALVNIASAHPLYDIQEVLCCYKRQKAAKSS